MKDTYNKNNPFKGDLIWSQSIHSRATESNSQAQSQAGPVNHCFHLIFYCIKSALHQKKNPTDEEN